MATTASSRIVLTLSPSVCRLALDVLDVAEEIVDDDVFRRDGWRVSTFSSSRCSLYTVRFVVAVELLLTLLILLELLPGYGCLWLRCDDELPAPAVDREVLPPVALPVVDDDDGAAALELDAAAGSFATMLFIIMCSKCSLATTTRSLPLSLWLACFLVATQRAIHQMACEY